MNPTQHRQHIYHNTVRLSEVVKFRAASKPLKTKINDKHHFKIWNDVLLYILRDHYK